MGDGYARLEPDKDFFVMKTCKRCKLDYEVTFFNKERAICKKCLSDDGKKYIEKKKLELGWVEKQRIRSSEKYYRIPQKKKTSEQRKQSTKNLNTKFPEKVIARGIFRNIARRFVKSDKLNQLHHWSYLSENAKQFFEISKSAHGFLHRHLIYDTVLFCYKTKKGILLNTDTKHEDFINELGLTIIYKSDKNGN